MNILVTGTRRLDAGKTTVALGLVAHLDAIGFKPRGGNDYWYSYDHLRETLEQGRLYGNDADRLAEASPGDLTPEEINSVHRLWRQTTGEGTGLLGDDTREFVLDRAGDQYVVNGTAEMPALVRRSLPLDDAITIESVPALNDAIERYHLPAQASLRETIEAADRAVVESYSDVARPVRDLNVDVVAVVEPTRVRLYDGARYDQACEVAPGGHATGQLEETVTSVTTLLDARDEVSVSPLPETMRDDPTAIAEAYHDLYERLLAIAPT